MKAFGNGLSSEPQCRPRPPPGGAPGVAALEQEVPGPTLDVRHYSCSLCEDPPWLVAPSLNAGYALSMISRMTLPVLLLLLLVPRVAGAAARVPVLAYHHLAPAALGLHHEHPVVVTVEDFQRQMNFLAEQGFTAVTLDELAAFVRGDRELPERAVVITFDDGYASVYHYAYPVLQALGFKASVFIIGNRIPEQTEPYDPTRLTYASWQQLREMVAAGVVTVENHSWDGHDEWIGLPPFSLWDRPSIARDFDRVSGAVEAAGLPRPAAVAYPFGAYDRQVVAAAEAAGLTLGFTVREGFVVPGDDLLRLRRQPVFGYHSLDDLAAMLSACGCLERKSERRLKRLHLEPGRDTKHGAGASLSGQGKCHPLNHRDCVTLRRR